MKIENFKQRGYVVLISVIILAAIGLSLTTSLLLLSLGHGQSSLASVQSAQANALAQACAETALDSLRQDSNFSGNQILTLGNGNCNILPIVLSGTVYNIKTQGNIAGIVRKMLVQAERKTSPTLKMQVNYWQEVADF